MEVVAVFSTRALAEDRGLEALLQLGGKCEVIQMMSWPIWDTGTCCATHLLAVPSFTSVIKFSNPRQKFLQAWPGTLCLPVEIQCAESRAVAPAR